MTRLRILGLGIIFLFCMAAVIAAAAQSTLFTTLVNFDVADGAHPSAALIQATEGLDRTAKKLEGLS